VEGAVSAERNTCWLFHRWSKWTTPEINQLMDDKKNYHGDVLKQRRVCNRCNQTQMRQQHIGPMSNA
jgi:hypothetical protein